MSAPESMDSAFRFGLNTKELEVHLLTNEAITPFVDPEIESDADIDSFRNIPRGHFASVAVYLQARKLYEAIPYNEQVSKLKSKKKSKSKNKENDHEMVKFALEGAVNDFSTYDTAIATEDYNDVYSKYFLGTFEEDWDESIHHQIVYRALQLKFYSNADEAKKARDVLLATEGQALVYESTGDDELGTGADGTGNNVLGTMLMQLRQQLLHERLGFGGDAQLWDDGSHEA